MKAALAVLLLLLIVPPAAAQNIEPWYGSLRADRVNLRTGPGQRHPIDWVYQHRGLPVLVLAESDVWRKIRDSDGIEGWVHQSMLGRERRVLVTGSEPRIMLRQPDPGARPVARLEPGVIARLQGCDDGWCRISVDSYNGWLPQAQLWGVEE